MNCLLDTSVVVTHLRNRQKGSYFNEIGIDSFGISSITVAELYRGCFKSKKAQENITQVKELLALPEVVVYPLDEAVALEYGRLMADLEEKGIKLDHPDVYIAATARYFSLELYSKDKKHFKRLENLGVTVKLF